MSSTTDFNDFLTSMSLTFLAAQFESESENKWKMMLEICLVFEEFENLKFGIYKYEQFKMDLKNEAQDESSIEIHHQNQPTMGKQENLGKQQETS